MFFFFCQTQQIEDCDSEEKSMLFKYTHMINHFSNWLLQKQLVLQTGSFSHFRPLLFTIAVHGVFNYNHLILTAKLHTSLWLTYSTTTCTILYTNTDITGEQWNSPSNSGQIFLQQVTDPWLVYWPRAVSIRKRGMPQANRKTTYGMKNTPKKRNTQLFLDSLCSPL